MGFLPRSVLRYMLEFSMFFSLSIEDLCQWSFECSSMLATYVRHGGSKGKENIYVERKGEKVAFVGVELTPSAIRAVVLSQLD